MNIILSALKSCLRFQFDSGGGGSTTTQNIPAELKPLATAYSNKAIDLSQQGFSPFTGQRFADLNQTQNAGLDMMQNRAMNGSQTINNAESNLNQMIGGGSNPFLDANVNKAMDQVQGRVNSQFGGSNYGTTAHQETLQSGLGDVANQMYGGAYENDQNRRLSAINSAPTFGNQAYQDASQMLNAGQVQQDQDQQGLDFNYQQYGEEQNLPYKQLAAMSGVFGSNLGGSSTTSGDGK